MADTALLNQGILNGTYDGNLLEVSSNILSTTLISGLTAVKSADKNIWLSGYLTYTITITNNEGSDFESPVLTDILDITQVQLVDNSVKVNGSTVSYTYDDVTGLLTLSVPTVASGATVVITFQVEKV